MAKAAGARNDANPKSPRNSPSTPDPDCSTWLGLDASAAAVSQSEVKVEKRSSTAATCLHFTLHSLGQGFAMGAGSFGTYEFVKRTLPRAASSLLGPAAPADLATPILLTACALQSIVCAVCGAPFESSRAMVMAGTSAGGRDPPATLGAALGRIMSEPSADGETTSANSSPSAERDSVEFRRLWDGLPMLLSRELPFGVTKLFVYAATQART